MVPESQRRVFAFLAQPETHGPGTGRVEQIHTHISALFLAGDRVLKAKRAVALSYLDHTDINRRRAVCDTEVAVNAPGAPDLYLGVLPVTEDAEGALALDGPGRPVDWLVAMRRFDQDALFDRLLAQGALDRHQMCDLAEAVEAAHRRAPTVTHRPEWLRGILESVTQSLRDQAPALGAAAVADLVGGLWTAADQAAPLLARRVQAGRVRRCHGDLHLRNIVLWQGRPTLFDAIDFDDALAEIDVLYDLAFLLMDLDSRGHRRLASIVFNHYMEFAGDTEGLALMPLFLALRAGIRAFVSTTQAAIQDSGDDGTAPDPERAAALRAEAAAYLAQALAYLTPPPPRLVAVGGLSGSGKSRLAREVAPHLGPPPGALVLRTDVLRKRLMGCSPYQTLGPEGYTAEMHARTYAVLETEARIALAAGHSVVLDGVHAMPQQRAAAEALARAAGVRFDGLWVAVPQAEAQDRIATRQRNPSDVTAEVRAAQEGLDPGEITWGRVDSSGAKEATVVQGLARLGLGPETPSPENAG